MPSRTTDCLSASCKLTAILLLCFVFLPSSGQCGEVVLIKRDGLTKDLTLKDAAGYAQMSIDITETMWKAFSLNAPNAAGDLKDVLSLVALWQETSNVDQDPKAMQRTLKAMFDIAVGKGIDWWDSTFGTPYGTILTVYNIYKGSLNFIKDRFFVPYLVDMAWDSYRSIRADGTDHDMAMSMFNIPEPVTVNTILEVVLKKRGIQAGVMSGAVSMDGETYAKLEKSASGQAAGRKIVVIHKPGMSFPGGKPFGMNGDISQLIELQVSQVDNWQAYLLDVRNRISNLDLELRGTAGYRPLTATDERAVEAQLKKLLDELENVLMGPKIKQEAHAHIGKTLEARYAQLKAWETMKKVSRQAKADLAKRLDELAAYTWPRLVHVYAMDENGQKGEPIASAALHIDGKLCLSDTNGGKPGATNRYGLVALHLSDGGHDVVASAPGYQPAEIRIFSQSPRNSGQAPEEYEILLQPTAPVDVTVQVSSDADGTSVAGASVRLQGEGMAPLKATSDDQGMARFAQVPASARFDVTADAVGYKPDFLEDVAASPEPVSLELSPLYARVEALVTGPGNKPQAGATVVLDGRSGTTNADGKAVFESVPPSPPEGYVIQAKNGALPPVEQRLKVAPEHVDQVFRTQLSLVAAGTVLVVVRDADNRMVSGAQAVLTGPGGRKAAPIAGQGGIARFSGLEPGTYSVTATAPEYDSPQTRQVVVSTKTPMHKIRLVLMPPSDGLRLTVKVVDKNGTPVDATVMILETKKQTVGGTAVFSDLVPGEYGAIVMTPDERVGLKSYTADGSKSEDAITVTVQDKIDTSQSHTPDRALLESLMPAPGSFPLPPSTKPTSEDKQWHISSNSGDPFSFPHYDPRNEYTGLEELTYEYSAYLHYTADPLGENIHMMST